jgi:hypothetical protein
MPIHRGTRTELLLQTAADAQSMPIRRRSAKQGMFSGEFLGIGSVPRV